MANRDRGLLDTSTIIDLDHIDLSLLPPEAAIAAVTLAELSVGPHAAKDDAERGRRQDRLQRAESRFEVIPFGAAAARAYALFYATLKSRGHGVRGRLFDLLIAATARAAQLPLYTRNPGDFEHLGNSIEIVAI